MLRCSPLRSIQWVNLWHDTVSDWFHWSNKRESEKWGQKNELMINLTLMVSGSRVAD
jgi:hypothetical protein